MIFEKRGQLSLFDYEDNGKIRVIGGTEEECGYSYEIEIKHLLNNRSKYSDLLTALSDDEFILKAEYNAMCEYLDNPRQSQKETDDDLI